MREGVESRPVQVESPLRREDAGAPEDAGPGRRSSHHEHRESGEDPPEFARRRAFEDTDSTMSQQNVAVARRWVELFNERSDVDEFLSLHDPEVELQTPGGPRLQGHDQVRAWFDEGLKTCSRASSRSAS